MSKTLERIKTARAKLLFKSPFLGYIALYLKLVEKKDVRAFATDGEHIFFNKKFANKQSMDNLVFILAHEIMHVLLGHLKRQVGRDPIKWNVACDYAVNHEIARFSFAYPKNALIKYEYAGLSAEEIYKRLRFKKIVKCICDIIYSDKKGIPVPRDILIQARNYAKQRGLLPGSLEEIVSDALKEKVDWRRILYKFMFQAVKDDYTFLIPNKRYRQFGVILPSLKIYKVDSVVVAIDTSGSIERREFAQFLGEIKAIVATGAINTLYVITCDADVQDVYTFRGTSFAPQEVIKKIKLRGRGGTDFVPVFKYLQQKNIKPSCLVYLTDGYGSYPQNHPPYPVMWVLSQRYLPGEYRPPFGQSVFLDLNGG